MHCPQCRCEFRPGFTHCNTCDVDLVEELPPKDHPKEEPESYGRWELNRTDSRNIAFIKGALVGMAVAQVVGVALSMGFQGFSSNLRFSSASAVPWWFTLYQVAMGMVHPVGIVIGGFVGRSRTR
jgi:hypothetical protein